MTTRRLAAILAADVAGFSSMMEQDEEGTAAQIRTLRWEVIEPALNRHQGRLIKTTGDGFLAEFASPVEAVRSALEIQDQSTSASEALRLRIGLNLGDIIFEDDGDVLGDGVNVAARLEQLADPGSILVSEDIQRQVTGKVPLTFADRGEQQLKNIARPVRIFAVEAASKTTPAQKALPLPDKPSIAVLPFTNMTGDPEQDPLSDGIVEEIIAALSRVRSFFVISRNSSFTYKGRAVDPRRVGQELGVRYVLEGSLRKAGTRVRIMAQLIEATTGSHIWGERYEGELADIFELQDRVTEAVVGAIEPTITLSEIERVKRKRPESLDAYECVMRALPAIWSQDPDAAWEGLTLAERAIALDPDYALPKAVAAWCYAQRLPYLRTSDSVKDRARTLDLAKAAVRLDSNDPLVLTLTGAAYTLIREFKPAASLIEKALALDPNSAWAWTRSGWLNVYLHRSEIAIEHFRRAMRLSPLEPMNFNVLFGIAAAHFGKGEYDKTITWVEKGLEQKPDAYWVYRMLGAAYALSDRLEDAKRAVALLLDNYPGLTLSKVAELTPTVGDALKRIVEGLRKAGLPE